MFVSNQSSCRRLSGKSVRKFLLTNVRQSKSASPIPMASISRWQSQIPLVKSWMWLISRWQVRFIIRWVRTSSCSRSIWTSHQWRFLFSSSISRMLVWMIVAPSVRTKYSMQIDFWVHWITWFMHHYQQRLSSFLFFRHNVSKIQEHCKSEAFYKIK